MKAIIKRLKSKTYWAAIIGALLMVLERNSGFFGAYIPESARDMALMLWPVLMVALREITTTSVSEK